MTLGQNQSYITAEINVEANKLANIIEKSFDIKLHRYEGTDKKGNPYLFFIGNESENFELNIYQSGKNSVIGCVAPDRD